LILVTVQARTVDCRRENCDQIAAGGLNLNDDRMNRKKILVPVNFSLQSDAALKMAIKLSGPMHGMITCLHIIEDPGYIIGGFISREVGDRIRREAEQRLSIVANRIIDDKKIPFEIIVTSGKVHRKIMEKAVDLNASVIIMGRSDSRDMNRNAIGSNAIKVITSASVPVITTTGTRFPEQMNILLPLDLSKPVSSKLAKAVEIARLLNAKVSVLAVLGTLQGSLEENCRQKLEEIRHFLEQEEITSVADLVISDNPVPREIISYASANETGIIMVMTQQERDITDFFIGSTAQEIMNKSDLPVLSIIPEDQGREPPQSSSIGNLIDPMSFYNIN
jgi:nucleotide-binding universal stress UspA family protein